MPMTPGCQSRPQKQDNTIFHAAGVLVQLLQSSFQDLLFRLLPGGVDLPQLAGQLCSPVLILTQHQLQSGNSAVHAARRIDPGGQCIADILGCKGFACKAGLFQQRLNARPVGLGQLTQTRLDQGAVLSGQGHDICYRAHRCQIPQYSSISSGIQPSSAAQSLNATPAPHRPLKGL